MDKKKDSKGNHKCSQCSETFNTKTKLQVHQKTHAASSSKKAVAASSKKTKTRVKVEPPKNTCKNCDKTLPTPKGLKLHEKSCLKDKDETVSSSDSEGEIIISGDVTKEKATPKKRGRPPKNAKNSSAKGKKTPVKVLRCKKCGLGLDPKKDGHECKNCTKDNIENADLEELGDIKKLSDEEEEQVNNGLELENGAEGDGSSAEDMATLENAGEFMDGLDPDMISEIITPDATLQCPVCGKIFGKKYYLQRHLQMTACSGGPPPSHPCEVCGKVYSRKDNLREHLRAHAGEITRKKKYKCDYCSKKFHGLSLLKIHIRVHTGERPFTCEYCPKAFPSAGALNKHVRIHTGEKPYSCAECGMRFSLKGTLNRHTRIHTGIRPHKCHFCGKQFIQAGGLKAHLFNHTGTDGFKCDHCDKTFNRKARLAMHVRYIHLRDKPYKCIDCDKSFTRKEDLNRHSILHTGEKPHECPTCHKRFAIKPSLKLHLITHTKEEPRSCHECGRAFIRKDCLMRHMRKRHRDLLDKILMDEQDDKYSQTMNTNEPIRILSEQALCDSIKELLSLLVDEPTLKGFGWPDKPVDELLEAVIRRCGHTPASPEDYSYLDRLRENSKLLFTVVIDDNAVKTLLNNQTVDEVILHVLRLAKS